MTHTPNEVIQAARHVFQQMQDIARQDGPPLIQDWGRIDRLGQALKEYETRPGISEREYSQALILASSALGTGAPEFLRNAAFDHVVALLGRQSDAILAELRNETPPHP